MTQSITRGAAVAAALLISTTLASPVAASDKVAVYGRWVDAEEAAAAAAALPAPEPVAPEWGSANAIFAIGACEAGIRDATHTFHALNCQRVEPIVGGTGTAIGFPVHLPSGALITSVKMNYFDNHTGTPSVGFYRVDQAGALTIIVGMAAPVFAGGNATTTATVPAGGHTVNNLSASYQILAILSRDAAGNTGIYGFEINYRLQVSAAPATATFPNDVPTTHPFFRFVEAMAASGLTGGCSAGSFCPDNPVTRGQMAVFLATALGLNFPN